MADIKKMLDDDGVQFYPETSANGCYLDDGTRLVDHCLTVSDVTVLDGTVPIDADKLGGVDASKYSLLRKKTVSGTTGGTGNALLFNGSVGIPILCRVTNISCISKPFYWVGTDSWYAHITGEDGTTVLPNGTAVTIDVYYVPINAWIQG